MARKQRARAKPKAEAKTTTKAHCFHVLPREGTAAEISHLLRAFARKATPIELSVSDNRVQVCEPHWRTAAGAEVFTATAFKVRSNLLPSLIDSAGPKPLQIPAETGLGEPMCFALDPVAGVAVVYSAAQGPKHAVIAALLRAIGFPHEVQVETVLRADMIERLNRTTFVKSFTFKLEGVGDQPDLSAAGIPAEKAIELAGSVRADDVLVELSIGVEKEGLALAIVKKAARVLYDIGGAHVSRLSMKASESEDKKCQVLDLLNARLEVEIDVAEDAGEMNREDCHQKLLEAMKEVVPGIRKQKPT